VAHKPVDAGADGKDQPEQNQRYQRSEKPGKSQGVELAGNNITDISPAEHVIDVMW